MALVLLLITFIGLKTDKIHDGLHKKVHCLKDLITVNVSSKSETMFCSLYQSQDCINTLFVQLTRRVWFGLCSLLGLDDSHLVCINVLFLSI